MGILEVIGHTMMVVLAAFIAVTFFWWLLIDATVTGPNCPGKDPEWIGYCHKANP